jgi:hypothetical protein
VSPRLFCNIVWARLLAGQDREGRETVEREVYAPAEGWGAAEANLWDRIMGAGEEG